MKKICFLLFLICAFFTGCADSGLNNVGEDKLSVVTTVFPAYDFAKAVYGHKANVELLLPPGTEAHSYEPSPKDIIKIQNCNLFIYNGGTSDVWVDNILSSLDKKPETLKMMEHSSVIEHNHEHNESHDEHIWLNIKNAVSVINAICDKAVLSDSDNARYYIGNSKSYCEKLGGLDMMFEKLSRDAVNKTLVFADRFPAVYFTEGYGFKYLSAFDGCADKAEPGSAKIAELIKSIEQNNIDTVFYIEFSNQKVADSVCEATGAAKKLFHSCHTVSADELKSGVTYYSLMQSNYNTLSEVLK